MSPTVISWQVLQLISGFFFLSGGYCGEKNNLTAILESAYYCNQDRNLTIYQIVPQCNLILPFPVNFSVAGMFDFNTRACLPTPKGIVNDILKLL